MEAKDTIVSACRLCSSAENQAEVSFKAGYEKGIEFLELTGEVQFKAGVQHERERMTKALRDLHEQGWTLADVIQAEDDMGGE